MKQSRLIFLCLIVWITSGNLVYGLKKTYGGEKYDRGISVQQTSDKGFVLVGYTRSFGAGGEDVWLIKTDDSGEEQWNKTFGGENDDNGWAVLQTKNNGYILTGFTKSFGAGAFDVFLINTDAKGKKLWSKTYGGQKNDRSWDLDVTKDGGYIVIGETENDSEGERDVLLIKVDGWGKVLWKKKYGGAKDDRCFSVRQTSDGGFIFAGITYSFGEGDRDAWVIKTDNQGVIQWQKTFGGKKSDVAHCVRLTNDGGYIVTGYTSSFSSTSNQDCYLIKLNSKGELQWNRVIGGENSYHTLYGQQTRDDGYIITGGVVSIKTRLISACLIKTDGLGQKQWERTFNEMTYKPFTLTRGYNGGVTSDGGYMLTGDVYVPQSEKGEVYFVKVNPKEK
jgi:hypothetical protein